ncbi:MAG: DUF177 domain-containing protein [Candidatus Eisenbacteria bacterium]|nr:DUF177 domain-containing protein [Candidatus Eisenbacteria bacterium]
MSSFVIDLGSLRPGLTRVELEAGPRDLDLPETEWTGRVRGVLDVERTGERLTLRGTLSAQARVECVRCLVAYDLPVEARLELFAERAGTGRRTEEEALERDDYMKFHDGRKLDLREDARETLLLELPMIPRCREGCRGLCPRCGADLNQGPCGCPES